MERGKLFFHYLAGEELICEPDGDGLNGEPRFKICIVGDEERIEIRDIVPDELAALRDKITAALDRVPKNESPSAVQP